MAGNEVTGCCTNMEELDQFASSLAESIVEQSLETLSRNKRGTVQTSSSHTCVHRKALEDHPSNLNITKCSSEQLNRKEDNVVSNETNNCRGDFSVRLQCYAHELCCDIINGALNNYDISIKKTAPRESKCLSSHIYDISECGNVSTDRMELFCRDNVRPTLIIRSTEKSKQNSSYITKQPMRTKKKKTRYKKKLEKELAKYRPGKLKNDKFLSSIEEDPPIDDLDDTSTICPVCLDVYYNAHVCKPCDHTFCEPCLRRLAKYCSDAGKTSNCPVCREPIHHCQKDFDLTETIKEAFPHDCRRRRNTDAHSKYMNHPLPSQPTQTVDSAIISHILRRRQQERQRSRNPLVGFTPIRINFGRYISLAVFFVIIKALALMVIVAVYNAVLVE